MPNTVLPRVPRLRVENGRCRDRRAWGPWSLQPTVLEASFQGRPDSGGLGLHRDLPEPKPCHGADTEFGEKWKRDLRTNAAGSRGRVFQDRRNPQGGAHTNLHVQTCPPPRHQHTRAPKPSAVTELLLSSLSRPRAAHEACLGSRAAHGALQAGICGRGHADSRGCWQRGGHTGSPVPGLWAHASKCGVHPLETLPPVLWDLSPRITSRVCSSPWRWWLECRQMPSRRGRKLLGSQGSCWKRRAPGGSPWGGAPGILHWLGLRLTVSLLLEEIPGIRVRAHPTCVHIRGWIHLRGSG